MSFHRGIFVLVLAALAGCGAEGPAPAATTVAPIRIDPSDPADLSGIVISDEPWTFEAKEGRLIRTPSYRVYLTTTRAVYAERLPTFLERCLIHYVSAITMLPRPREEMETYLMANRPQWARLTQRVMGDEADIYLQIQRGGFSAQGRAVLYDIGQRDTFFIAAHEGWHQYTQKTFRSSLPVSFEEGFATYMEGHKWDSEQPGKPVFLPWCNFERHSQLRRAVSAGRLKALATVVNGAPQDLIADDPEGALVYYAQVWAFIHFLREGEGGVHRADLERLLRDAASGNLVSHIRTKLGGRAASLYGSRRGGVDLVKLYFGSTAAEMDPAYRVFVTDITKVGSRERIAAGKSPVGD